MGRPRRVIKPHLPRSAASEREVSGSNTLVWIDDGSQQPALPARLIVTRKTPEAAEAERKRPKTPRNHSPAGAGTSLKPRFPEYPIVSGLDRAPQKDIRQSEGLPKSRARPV